MCVDVFLLFLFWGFFVTVLYFLGGLVQVFELVFSYCSICCMFLL